MDWLLEQLIRYPRRCTAIAVAVLMVGGGLLWWQLVWQNSRHVFADMLANNLTTSSVTKIAAADSGSQSVAQYARLQMGGTNAADWLVVAKQNDSSVTTESIGTRTTGYIRYTNISTTQTKNGKPYSFASVLNVWGKSDGKTDTSLSELFDQTLLDVGSAPLPPIADLPAAQRENILLYIREQKVFTADYKTVTRQTLQGRPVYTYSVSVQLGAYVRMMQAFAHDLGMTNLDDIDPSQYATAPPVALTMSVDRLSHQLVQVTYPANGFSQRYTDWGLMTPVRVPKETISTTQLQQRITALGSGSL